MDKYYDRHEAGQVLSRFLTAYQSDLNTIILALPRGGVPVAYELANKLHLPLDVFIVRKLGVPAHQELAMGAIAMGGIKVLNQSIIHELDIEPASIQKVIERESKELTRRAISYRGHKPYPELVNKTIILVDDGIATGATMQVAVKALRLIKPKEIIIAVPVAPYSTCIEMANLADKIICPLQPKFFSAVGEWYHNFSQTEDEEVISILNN